MLVNDEKQIGQRNLRKEGIIHMTAQDCIQMLREIKDVAFATVDEAGQPQIRIIDVMLADGETLYFCTARGKEFYREILAAGRTAVAALNEKYQMIRLSGKVKKLEDQKKWIDRIFEENPSMNQVYPGESRYILEPFCIESGQVEFFDLGKEPVYREQFSFGREKEQPRGFRITKDCIGCGTCAGVCPQKCISAGEPYQIDPCHCLHCGLCQENCPAGAVERLAAGIC